MTTIGSRMKQLRMHTGLSGERFGELVGVTKSSVSQWESDDTMPDTAILIKLAAKLDFSMDWLLTGNGYAPDANRPLLALMKVAEKLPDDALTYLTRQGDDLAQLLKPGENKKTGNGQ